MRNGGSPPAHLSPSSDAPIDPSGWLKIKWSQSPPRASDWVIVIWDVPPADPDHGDWLARTECEDRQTVVGVLPSPPLQLGGDVTTDRFIADIRYQNWKEHVDFLWEDARLHSRWEENFRLLDALIAEER
jgi:hypothetical protein